MKARLILTAWCVWTWNWADWPWDFWLLFLGLCCWQPFRQALRDALYWNPEIVGEIARRDIERREPGWGGMPEHPYTGAGPGRH